MTKKIRTVTSDPDLKHLPRVRFADTSDPDYKWLPRVEVVTSGADLSFLPKFVEASTSDPDYKWLPRMVNVVAAPSGDPYWANVIFLAANDNAANGTTTFDDQSTSNWTVTRHGDASYTNTQAPTGMTTSVTFDGTGDYLQTAEDAAFGMGAGDFVAELWVRQTSFVIAPAYFDLRSAGNSTAAPLIYCASSGAVTFYQATVAQITSAAGVITNGTWNHVAAVRSGTNVRLYVNGSQVGSTWAVGSSNFGATGRVTLAGNYTLTGGLTGQIAAARLTKGSDRGWSGTTITVPSLPLLSS